MKIQSNVICAVSCSPKTTLLKIETVFAGKIFVAISAVFNFVSILTSFHHPSNINLRIKWCFVFICLNLDWLTFRFWALIMGCEMGGTWPKDFYEALVRPDWRLWVTVVKDEMGS